MGVLSHGLIRFQSLSVLMLIFVVIVKSTLKFRHLHNLEELAQAKLVQCIMNLVYPLFN